MDVHHLALAVVQRARRDLGHGVAVGADALGREGLRHELALVLPEVALAGEQAFTEKENNSDYKKITSADVSFQNALSVLDYSRDSDIRKTFEVKSSTAGYTVGNNIYNQSGIGGISYSNRMRGT